MEKIVTEENVNAKFRIKRTIISISVAFMCFSASYEGLGTLQSSINQDIGITAMCVSTASSILSSILLSSFVVQRFGCKIGMLIGLILLMFWFCANFYPRYYTLVPLSVISGSGYPVLLASTNSFLTILGVEYADLTDQMPDGVIQKFFGIFYMTFMIGPVWGTFLSSAILGIQMNDATNMSSIDGLMNASLIKSFRNINSNCGAEFCFMDSIKNESSVNSEQSLTKQYYMLVGLYSIIVLCAMFIIASVPKSTKSVTSSQTDPLKAVASYVKQMTSKKQILLSPLTLYMGLAEIFYLVEYPQAFVSCAIGVEYVGVASMCNGITYIIMSFSSTYLVKVIGRVPVFIIAGVAHLGIFTGCLIHSPEADAMYAFFLIPSIWGVGGAVFQMQLCAFYGVLFTENKEVAFSYFRTMEATAMLVSLAYSAHLCVYVKIYIMVALLVLGLVGYFIVEYMQKDDMDKSEDVTGQVTGGENLYHVATLVRKKSLMLIPEATKLTVANIIRRRSVADMSTSTEPKETTRLLKRRNSLFVPLPSDRL